MKKLTIAIVAFGLFALSVEAQSARIDELRRVSEGLNSADPITRLVTLEEAVASGDSNVRRLALQTAFQSSDPVLQGAAVEQAFASKNSLLAKIVLTNEHKPDGIARKLLGGQLEIFVENYMPNTGTFVTWSNFSRWSDEDGRRRYTVHPGTFSGTRISFVVDVQNVRIRGEDKVCRGSVTSQKGSAVLIGSMACDFGSRASYDISIDLLS